MANEWVKVELYGANNDGSPRRITIADGTAVSKGTLCNLTDPRTTTGAAASAAACSGVASEEKNANDGATSISVWTDGIFNATASGAISVGDGLRAAGSNQVATLDLASMAAIQYGAGVIGYCLYTGEKAETVNVRLRL